MAKRSVVPAVGSMLAGLILGLVIAFDPRSPVQQAPVQVKVLLLSSFTTAGGLIGLVIAAVRPTAPESTADPENPYPPV